MYLVHRQSRVCLLLFVLVLIFILQSSKVAADNSVRVLQYEGIDYALEIEFSKSANIPDEAILKVAEIIEGTKEFEEYYSQTKEAISKKDINYVRFFDISIIYGNEEIEPEAPVNVLIRYNQEIEKQENEKLDVIHFMENGSEEFLEVKNEFDVDNEVTELSFEQSSFSVIGMIIFDGNDSELINSDSELIQNTRVIDVIKEWSDGNEQHTEDEVTVTLYESDSENENWAVTGEKVLCTENEWKVQFENLSEEKKYKVKETKVVSKNKETKVTYKSDTSVSVCRKWMPSVNNQLEDGGYVFLVFNNGNDKILRKSSKYAQMDLRSLTVTVEENENRKYLSDNTETIYLWRTVWNEEYEGWEFYTEYGNAYITLAWNEVSQQYEWKTSREKTEGSYLRFEDGIISAAVDGKTLYLGNVTAEGPYKALEENDIKITKFDVYSYQYYKPAICKIINTKNEPVEEKEIQTDVTTNKIIDYLGDKKENPETIVDNQYPENILRDLYRLKLEATMQTDATGLDLLMVIDVSSSMKGAEDAKDENGNNIKRSEALRQALNVFIPVFLSENERNRLAVVAFEEQSIILQDWTSEDNQILEIINYTDEMGEMPLYNGNGTNYEAALARAHEVLSMRGYSGNAQAMFFLSDGSPTTYIGGNDDQEPGNITINLGNAELTDQGIDGREPEGMEYVYTGDTQESIDASNEAIESFKRYHSKLMVGTIAFNTKVTDCLKNLASDSKFVTKIENGTPKDLINAMELITEYIPKKVVIIDELSENAELFEEKPDYLVTQRNEKGEETVLYSSEKGITDDGKLVLTINEPIKLNDKKIELHFQEEYEVKNNYTYSFSFNIKASQIALNKYADNSGLYTDLGDKNTDYEGNDTSSEKAGFYSNGKGSCVKYDLNGAEVRKNFKNPVIQARSSKIKIKKSDLDKNVFLKDAVFALYRKADSSDENTIEMNGMTGKFVEVSSGITNDEGEIEFEHLRVSVFEEGYQYYLIEKESPEGYIKCEDILQITLFDESVKVEENNSWISVDEEGDIVVLNAEYVEPLDLPVTGGNGNKGFYMIGILFMIGGILCLKRKEFQS